MMARGKTAGVPHAAVVAAAKEIKARPAARQLKRVDVEGFGCPRTDWPHHVRVVIPEIRGGDVQVIEDFGVGGHAAGQTDEVIRCVLSRTRWGVLADVARREFNERLRALGLPVGAWKPGVTKVERMLGLELVLLASICAIAEEADLPAITASWAALRPEERWWFAGWLMSRPSEQVLRGAALLFSGGPTEGRKAGFSVLRPQPSLPLFDLPPAGKC
jgi:hypothetical protein